VPATRPGGGQGATFIVRLPIRILHKEKEGDERVHPTAPTQTRVILKEPPNLSGVKVLLIDDELDTRILLRAVLEQCNAEIRDAGVVEEGLDIAKTWEPSIVIS